MRVVIIEDELAAAEKLRKMIGNIRSDFHIEAVLQSIAESVKWFTGNSMPDLVFMDIQLADGSSFGIFDKVNIDCPIIFITAYNEYALEAFEVNGIDYLLKPLNQTRLAKAITKFGNIGFRNNNTEMIAQLAESMQQKMNKRKTYFLVPHRDKLIPLAVSDIAYIYADMKTAKAITLEQKAYPLDHSLDDLMEHLDPEEFFRVNRQCIISHKAIEDISIWFTGRLAVNLKVPVPEKITVSKRRITDFKAWFTRGS